MAKYHINKKGVPAVCRAKDGNCPLGDNDKHFNSKEEAQVYSDKMSKQEFGVLPTKVSHEERWRLLHHDPSMITKKIQRDLDQVIKEIPEYPVGTWVAFSQKTQLSTVTKRYVKIGENEWTSQRALRMDTPETPMTNKEMKSLLSLSEDLDKVGVVDSNKKYYTYSIEYYDDEDEICEINSDDIPTLSEARSALKSEMKGLRVKEWWIHNQDGTMVEHW